MWWYNHGTQKKIQLLESSSNGLCYWPVLEGGDRVCVKRGRGEMGNN